MSLILTQALQEVSKNKKFLFMVFILAFFLRAMVFQVNKTGHTQLFFDSAQYHDIATHMLNGRGCSLATVTHMPQGDGTLVEVKRGIPLVNLDSYRDERFGLKIEPNFYRLPGYPLFLALCYRLFGSDIENALWVQLILASFIPILIFILSLVLFPRNLLVARMVALASAMHVGFVLYASIPLTESLFMLFFLLFCILFFSALSDKSDFKQFLLVGLLLGCVSLIRAVGHYLVVLSIIMLLCSRFSWRFKLQYGSIFAGGWLAVVSWWLIRNFALTGYFFFHTLPGHHFLQYSAVGVAMEVEHSNFFVTRSAFLHQWNNAIDDEELSLSHTLNQYETCRLAERIAFSYLAKHPLVTIKLACKEIARTCILPYSAFVLALPRGTMYDGSTTWWQKIKPFLIGQVVHSFFIPFVYIEIMMSLLMLVGILMFLWNISRYWDQVFKMTPFIGLLLFITLSYGCARLRLPAEPFLLIMAVFGLSKLLLFAD